jgi:hypothetical protein
MKTPTRAVEKPGRGCGKNKLGGKFLPRHKFKLTYQRKSIKGVPRIGGVCNRTLVPRLRYAACNMPSGGPRRMMKNALGKKPIEKLGNGRSNTGKTTLLFAILVATLCAVPAHAQATRTWVSGVGDHENPCSRTSPCKTFAGAIGKTATGGEINCLDPGGFGALAITESIIIDCHETFGLALVSGSNGITVDVPSGFVTLRNINPMAPSTIPPARRA